MELKTLEFKYERLKEMATPASHHLSTRYYHATSTESAAKGIIKSKKISVPSLRGDKSRWHGTDLQPIDGFVYMSDDLQYILEYLLGGPGLAGSKVFDRKDVRDEDPYGYVFVINNNDLTDIQPDEDYLGELISKVYQMRPDHWLVKLASKVLDPKILAKVLEWDYDSFALAGKALMPKLSDKQKLDIIDTGAPVANNGSVGFSEVWRFDKALTSQLKPNGSNLERLVEKDKTGRKFV